jgi:hypothetical protein
MKKFIAFVAIAGLAFSACNGRYTVAKRKYTKGFYVSKSSGGSTKSSETIAPVKTTLPEEKIETVVVPKAVSQEKAVPVEITAVRPLAKPAMENASNTKAGHQPVASASKSNYAPAAEIKPVAINAASAQKAKKGDTNIVLLVILSLFPILCLIAVYLHDGGITLNFWIDLLLHLTFIGEIIFALLVVLDIVDLS